MDNDFQKLLAIPIVQTALGELRERLPKTLVYHTYAHTEDVLREVYQFASQDKVTSRDVELLIIGAAFHDFGFVLTSTDNEALGAEEAAKRAEATGNYSTSECSAIKQMILDTKVIMTLSGPRQMPSSRLGQYLCDADVSNLGRPDFFEKVEQVRRELGIADEKEFLLGVEKFLAAHQWYSPAAQKMRTSQKLENVKALRVRLGKS